MYIFYCLDPRASIIIMSRTIRSSISSNTITALIINKAVKMLVQLKNLTRVSHCSVTCTEHPTNVLSSAVRSLLHLA